MEISRMSKERRKGVISLVILAFVFATMGIFARYLSTDFALLEQTYLRIGLAFLLGVILFYRQLDWRKLKTLPKKDWGILFFRAFALYLGVVLFTEALLNAKYGNASLIASFPLLPIFGYVFLRERLMPKTVLFILIGFVGVLLMTVGSLADFANFRLGYGEVMALCSVIAFDFSYIARRWHSDHLNNRESAVFMFAVGTILLFITSIILKEPTPTLDQFTWPIIGALVFSALFNVANLYLTNYGFQRVKVSVAGNILTLETIFAMLYSIFLFGEIPVLREWTGGALILISVYLVNRAENETANAVPTEVG